MPIHRTTTDAVEILKALFVNTPRQQRLYEEEGLRLTLGYALSGLREKTGLTQAQLAKKVGTSQSAIARIEDANYTGQKLATIARIAWALGHRVEVTLVKLPPQQRRAKRRSA